MVRINAETRLKIKNLSFIFAVLVVGCHSGKWVFQGGILARVFPSFLLFCAVPWFFCLSGFLMFKAYEQGWHWWYTTIKKRVLSLYVPLIVWNTVSCVLKIAKGDVLLLPTSDSCIYGHLIIQILGFDVFHSLFCGPFWFVRALLLFTVFAGIIGYILSQRVIGTIIVVVFMMANLLEIEGLILHTGIKVSSFAWFSLGAWISFNYESIHRLYSKIRKKQLLPSIIAAIFSFIYIMSLVFGGRAYGYIPITLMFSWLCIYPIIQRMKMAHSVLQRISDFSFFMFGAHPIMITLCHMVGLDGGGGYYTTWFASVMGSLALGWMLRRSFPAVFKVFNGWR